jgi:hypothetical protein
MSGTACSIIINGNKSQANAMSLATEQILAAASSAQKASANTLLTGFVVQGETLLGIRVRPTRDEYNPDVVITINANLVVGLARTICAIGYDNFTPAQQQHATDFMAAFNGTTDTLLAEITAS